MKLLLVTVHLAKRKDWKQGEMAILCLYIGYKIHLSVKVKIILLIICDRLSCFFNQQKCKKNPNIFQSVMWAISWPGATLPGSQWRLQEASVSLSVDE